MKNPPKLTPGQENLINESDTDQLEFWMNEIYPAIGTNLDLNKLYHYLNEVRTNGL